MTKNVILFVVVALALYDVWASYSGKASTLSHELYALSCRFPVIAFITGFLAGHVFFPLQER